MDVSVIFATYNRDKILNKTLDSFTRLQNPHLTHEIIVIDNAVRDETKALVSSFKKRIPVTYLSQPLPGKNNALNLALPKAKGNLLVFIDDDVIVQPDWLTELWAGVKRNPSFDVFGGTIKPHYPEAPIDERINLDHHSISPAFVITNSNLPEGEISHGKVWGPNMAVTRRVIDSGLKFNPNIGPNGVDYVMGSETEFLLRVTQAGFRCAFIPKAVVFHQIREDQLTLEWLAGRAVRQGKGSAAVSELPTGKYLFGAPRYLYKKVILHKLFMITSRLKQDHKQYYSHLIRHNFLKGQIDQYRVRSKGKH